MVLQKQTECEQVWNSSTLWVMQIKLQILQKISKKFKDIITQYNPLQRILNNYNRISYSQKHGL